MILALYLGRSWRTAEASGCGATLNQSLLLPYTTTRTTEGPQSRKCEEGDKIGNGPLLERGSVTHPAAAAAANVLRPVQPMGLHHPVHGVPLLSC